MKRLSQAQRSRMIRRTRRVQLRLSKYYAQTRVVENRKITKFRPRELTNRPTVNLYSKRGRETAKFIGINKYVPEILSLNKNYLETAKFLEKVRSDFQVGFSKYGLPKSKQHKVQIEIADKVIRDYYDFSTIKEISAPVALILASEYDCYSRIGGVLPGAVNIEQWDPNVRLMLEGVGFTEMCGVSELGSSILHGDEWKILRFRSGSEADGEQVDSLLLELGVQDALDNAELYGAILEALTNTRHHAYSGNSYFPEPHFSGWWLTGFVDKKSRHVRISVFDRGLTIPVTLPTWDKYNLFQRLWKRVFTMDPDPTDTSRDGSAIAVAMETGRTSTGEGYRGKGLPSMEEALDLCVDGHLTIYSRNGEYRRLKGQSPHYVNRAASIGGTLVTWDLRF